MSGWKWLLFAGCFALFFITLDAEETPFASCNSFTIMDDTCSGAHNNCTDCSLRHGCLWCSKTSACYPVASAAALNCSSFCSGSGCNCAPCTKGIFPCSETVIGLLILICFYGILLGCGAKLMSDGSEGLLELFPKWGTVIGALVLPVLGALPDSAIILVSGAFGSPDEAQAQLAIGVGTLAGSTIMLLTVPWAFSLLVARCDLNDVGEAIDEKSTKFSWTKQGVTVDQDTPTNAKIMLITSLCYFLVQGIAFGYLKDPEGKSAHKLEHPFTLAGFIICSLLLIGYCVYQVFVPTLAAKRQEKQEKEAKERQETLKALKIVMQMRAHAKPSAEPVEKSDEEKSAHAFSFAQKWKKKATEKKEEEQDEESPLLKPNSGNLQESKEGEEEHESFGKVLFKSIFLMVFGTAVVSFFSDPMVDAIGDFANVIKVNPFYVSFLITPYCSNASELISSLIFASAKKKENASLTFSQVYGAATMNNTMGLGIFCALVYFRGLVWTFTAETLSILLVTWIVGLISAFRVNFKLYWFFPVILCYPLSLLFVWILEKQAHWL